MADERFDLRRLDFADLFPWTVLFRCFRFACDPKKILFGAAGALLMSLGWSVIASFSSHKTAPIEPTPVASTATRDEYDAYLVDRNRYEAERRAYAAVQEARRLPWQGVHHAPNPAYCTVFDSTHGWTDLGIKIPSSALLVFEPIRQLTLPARMTFSAVGTTFTGLLLLFWTLAVWSLFAAAICRVSSVQIARNGNVEIREAIRFVLARYISFFTSPLLPFFAVVLVVVFCAIGGVVTRVPILDILAGLVWFLALLAGFVIVAALFGLVLGWPLMYAAIAAEATESFDALSRSFSYAIGRPWHYLFYTVLAAIYGAIVMIFVTAFAYGLVAMSAYAVSFGLGEAAVTSLYAYAPEAPGWRPASLDPAALSTTKTIAARLVGFWTHLVFLGLVGFVYSFFWTEVTAIYFLLRRDVDETDIEEVYLEEEDEEPFPTATPTVPGPAKVPNAPATPNVAGPSPAGPSLPIVDPPR